MKKVLFMSAMSMLSASTLLAEAVADVHDSLRMEELNEVVVQGIKAQKNAPFAKSNVDKRELSEFSRSGRELPVLFSRTPGIIAWGENGLGTGTSYMRIRGAGDSRINVTLDGVPLNSPEDQCVFWANMNSYGALLGNVQIQRGVGSSTNGDGAFGGTIALTSKAPDTEAGGELSGSYGSYNTFNVGGNFSTGLMGKHWIFDGAYHETNTDGYIHGTSGRSGSYYGGLTYLGNDFVVRYKNFGNFEKTGQAWNGLDTGDLLDGNYGMASQFHSFKDFYKAGLAKYNSLYESLSYDYNDQTGQYENLQTQRYQMRDGSYWPQTTDNFWQNRNILSLAWKINDQWSTAGSLHYTHGYGYYKEFRSNNKLGKFGLNDFTLSDGSVLKKTDFVRKKGLTQDCFGLVWNANYKNGALNLTGGLSVQDFISNHFGYLTYIANEELNAAIRNGKDYKYYDSDANKLDGSVFVKGSYTISEQWEAFADVQYRFVNYTTDGINDKFKKNDAGLYENHVLDIDKQYNFFNPKAGLTWHNRFMNAFASVAMSHREPERNNFTDNGNYPAPTAEQLLDYEAGIGFGDHRTWDISLTAYFMDYKDQFVQTGAKSDIGESLTTNIDKSYRTGIEIAASWSPLDWLTVEGNAALSKNVIKDFDEYAENWDDWEGNTDANGNAYDGDGFDIIHYDNSTLAFSPSTILNGLVTLHKAGFEGTWHTNYVSKQYLDNTESDSRSLPCYSTSNVYLSYTLPIRRGIRNIVFSLTANNVFDRHYAASGWVYSAIYPSGGHTNDNRYTEIGYIPQAGRTFSGSITVRF